MITTNTGLTRRELLLGTGALAGLSLLGPPGAPICEASPLPLISGALRQYHPSFSAQHGIEGWKRELDEEKAIGFNLLWLANVASALDDATQPDPLLQLLDLCAARGVEVILDVGGTPAWFSELDLAKETAAAGRNIERISERYGSHPAFFGWYLPQEIYVAWDAFGAYVESLYRALSELCKKAQPYKPVTLSPFFILDQDQVFGNFRYAPPQEYGEYWARLLRTGGIDIVMLQDSGEHFSYVTDEQRRPFFAAMQAAAKEAGARFWGNVETAEFECPSVEEYIRRYGRVHHGTVKDAPWRPVPLDRLVGKLELAARHTERIVTWGYVELCRPSLGPSARAWYEAYQGHYKTLQPK